MLSLASNSYIFSAECSTLFGPASRLLLAYLHFSIFHYFCIPAFGLFGGTALQLYMLITLIVPFVLDQLQ
jgi:hypothetical protein